MGVDFSSVFQQADPKINECGHGPGLAPETVAFVFIPHARDGQPEA